jgi:hypothetical protein
METEKVQTANARAMFRIQNSYCYRFQFFAWSNTSTRPLISCALVNTLLEVAQHAIAGAQG